MISSAFLIWSGSVLQALTSDIGGEVCGAIPAVKLQTVRLYRKGGSNEPFFRAKKNVKMAVHLVIDGYNVIRRSGTLGAKEAVALELGREALLERLRQYKRIRGHRITVVFDAASKPVAAEERSREKGITVIYSASGETADTAIKRMCRSEGGSLVVVTSDRELGEYAEGCGATVMDSEGFEEKMEMAAYAEVKGAKEEEGEGWDSRQGTRKKGPARRISKKERRRRQGRNKL